MPIVHRKPVVGEGNWGDGDESTWDGLLGFLGVAHNADGTLVGIYRGAGTPEGAVTAPIGSIYQRSDGGANTAVYRKESGAGNTGWVADSSAGGGLSAGIASYVLRPAAAGGYEAIT